MAEILIVEDDSLQHALIEQFVRPEHTVVGHVTTASRAVRFAIEHNPDVAVIDIGLEEGSGITAANEIISSTSGTELIISTARAGDQIKEQIQSMPIEAYLIKPYTKQDLLDAIERVA